jgi:hypothetical protein
VTSDLTPEFTRRFKRLPARVKRTARKNYKLWKTDPAHRSLDFKRVGTRMPVWSVRVGIGWRALGVRSRNAITWFWIGSHAEYDRLLQGL